MHSKTEGYVNTNKKVALVGVGGGGMNTLNEMLKGNSSVARLIAVNRDQITINKSKVPYKVYLDAAKNSPETMQAAVTQRETDIRNLLEGMDAVVLVAGLGGMTGSYASPEIARIAKQCGLAVRAVVTTPLHFEGEQRDREARKGLALLAGHADAVIRVNTQDLIRASESEEGISMLAAFRRVDEAAAKMVAVLAEHGKLTGEILHNLPDGFSLWPSQSATVTTTSDPRSRFNSSGDIKSQRGEPNHDDSYCSFCGKSRSVVKRLISGPMVFICNECVDQCVEIMAEEAG